LKEEVPKLPKQRIFVTKENFAVFGQLPQLRRDYVKIAMSACA
jgi:hypothetical protein